MLELEEIKVLAEKKEYTEIFNCFYDEYTEMMHDFLVRNDVELKEDDGLLNYILKTRIFMPKFSGYVVPITNVMYNENIDEEKRYKILMDSYPTIKKVFSEDA